MPELHLPNGQAKSMQIHLPTAEFLASAIRACAGAPYRLPSWQLRAFREGMGTAAEVVDELIAEAKRNVPRA